MNFKEEYIKAAEEFTPDRQTIDRMKENVLNMTRTKRALPFKTVAIVGGTAAACTVITIAAARIAPNIANDSNLIGESVNMATGSAADGMNGAADDVGADSAPEAAAAADGCDFYNGTMEIWDDIVYGEAVAPDVNYTDIKDVPAQEEAAADKSVDEPNDIATMAPAATYYPETLETDFESFDSEGCSPSEMSSAGGTYDKIIDDEPNVIPEDDCEDTLENEGFAATGVPVPFTGYTLTIAEDWSECTLSANGETLTYKRSPQTDTSSFANNPSILYIPLTNTTDNKTYMVALADSTVIIRDENLDIVGLFI